MGASAIWELITAVISWPVWVEVKLSCPHYVSHTCIKVTGR